MESLAWLKPERTQSVLNLEWSPDVQKQTLYVGF